MNKYIGMAVCSWLMGACQNDEMDVMQPQDSEQYTLIGQIDNEYADSRAQIQFGNHMNNVEYFFWNEGDHFTLYQNLNNELVASDFVISENYSEANGGALSAEFSSTTALTPSASYTAVYPCPTTVTDNKVRLEILREIDFTSATTDEQREAAWKNYFNNNMFMTAKGTLSESGRNYVDFDHLCSLARITYINQTGSEQQINSINLKGQNLGFYMNYNLISGEEAGSGSFIDYKFTTKNLTVADKDTVDLYIFFFPKAIEQADLQISINQPTGTKTVSLPSKDILFANGNRPSFTAGMRYWFDLTDTKDGLDWSKNLAVDNVITFENKELSTALHSVLGNYKVKMTAEGYAQMSKEHISQVQSLDFNWKGLTISSLAGIEHFVNLQELYCNTVGLVSCDLSKNTNLRYIDFAFNSQMETLNLSANTRLEYAYLAGCKKLKTLNIDACTNLKTIVLNNCSALTSVNIPNKADLLTLNYASTGLSFDLTQFTSLSDLNCSYTGLTSLNIPQDMKSRLKNLGCDGINLGTLNLSEYPNLTSLSCTYTGISTLDLSKVPNLIVLYCKANKIKVLDITPLNNLQYLGCGDQADNIVLQLKVTDAQKATWESNWSTNSGNKNVVLYGGVTDNSGSGNDFNNGGEF